MNMKKMLAVGVLALGAAFGGVALPVNAADVPVVKQLPGDITVDVAKQVMAAAEKKATEQGVPMNIAIVDAGGNLKAFLHQDGAFLGSIDISMKKAKTARYFNMPTSALTAASQPGAELYGIETTNNGLVIFSGGELLVKDGVIIGAIGVSGGTVEEDTNVAKAGAAALK